MIASLRGTIVEKKTDGLVVEVGGVGYAVTLTPGSLFQAPAEGGEVFLFIEESVAMYGGGVSLYGFLKKEERQIFNVLRENVPGTGAKKALEFLDKAAKSLPDFRRAVLDKDARALVSLFGFTAKTAEKIIAGLKGALTDLPVAKGGEKFALAGSFFDEAVQGLVSLGYRPQPAHGAVDAAFKSLGAAASAQDLIREALRRLSGRR